MARRLSTAGASVIRMAPAMISAQVRPMTSAKSGEYSYVSKMIWFACSSSSPNAAALTSSRKGRRPRRDASQPAITKKAVPPTSIRR